MERFPEFELPVGTVVEVRERFRGLWSRGFVIAESTDGGYLVRRSSDRSVLPTPFIRADIRAHR
jgi:hypothetical protein